MTQNKKALTLNKKSHQAVVSLVVDHTEVVARVLKLDVLHAKGARLRNKRDVLAHLPDDQTGVLHLLAKKKEERMKNERWWAEWKSKQQRKQLATINCPLIHTHTHTAREQKKASKRECGIN